MSGADIDVHLLAAMLLIGMDTPQITTALISTSDTGAAQKRRLRGHGLAVAALPELVDVDDATTADVVARLAPSSRFACALESLRAAA